MFYTLNKYKQFIQNFRNYTYVDQWRILGEAVGEILLFTEKFLNILFIINLKKKLHANYKEVVVQ